MSRRGRSFPRPYCLSSVGEATNTGPSHFPSHAPSLTPAPEGCTILKCLTTLTQSLGMPFDTYLTTSKFSLLQKQSTSPTTAPVQPIMQDAGVPDHSRALQSGDLHSMHTVLLPCLHYSLCMETLPPRVSTHLRPREHSSLSKQVLPHIILKTNSKSQPTKIAIFNLLQ